MKTIRQSKKGIKFWFVTAFVVTAIIPILLVNIVYYYHTSRLVQRNAESMTRANLEQVKVSLDVWLDSYEDILFQVYTDDNIVELVDKINAGEDVANNRKMLRKTLRGLFYTPAEIEERKTASLYKKDHGGAAVYICQEKKSGWNRPPVKSTGTDRGSKWKRRLIRCRCL